MTFIMSKKPDDPKIKYIKEIKMKRSRGNFMYIDPRSSDP